MNEDFIVETKLTYFDYSLSGDKAAVIVLFGKNFLKNVVKMSTVTTWRELLSMAGYNFVYRDMKSKQLPVFLRLEKTGFSVNSYYRYSESDDWVFFEKADNAITDEWQNLKAGLYVDSNSAGDTCASFEYFRYYGQKTFTSAEVTSDPIYLGGTPAGDGTISWQQDTGLYGAIKVRTRTSDDSVSWSAWSDWYDDNFGSVITSPKKMYVQFHAVLETTDADESPVLYGVAVEYPQIEKDKELITGFKVYPTISTGNVKAEFKINDFIKEIKAEIKESSGKTVREIDVP
ncbi:MAG: hypothetical protein ACLFP1_07035, partial [Candidatus Goldiibacteriota bacterium]